MREKQKKLEKTGPVQEGAADRCQCSVTSIVNVTDALAPQGAVALWVSCVLYCVMQHGLLIDKGTKPQVWIDAGVKPEHCVGRASPRSQWEPTYFSSH